MELIYIWIDKFRTFDRTEIKLTNKFNIKFDRNKLNIEINKNNDYVHIYPESIKNINLILGKNSSGKSSLLDLIGQRIGDREERTIEYSIENNGFMEEGKIKSKITKNSKFFMLYYLGNIEGEEIFCFEGNDIETYKNLIQNPEEFSIEYFNEKYWFVSICKVADNKLYYIKDLGQEKVRETIYKSEEELGIILMRENFNSAFKRENLKPADENKASIPRRHAKFKTRNLKQLVNFLGNQVKETKNNLFKDEKYTLNIDYGYEYSKKFPIKLDVDESNLSEFETKVIKVLSSLCLFFLLILFLNKNYIRIDSLKKD